MKIERIVLALSSLTPETLYEMQKSKKQYKLTHGECAVCANKKYLETHHVLPVHLFPGLACTHSNFINLCDPKNNGCHRWFGHFGNFRSLYNKDIREFAIASRLHLIQQQPEREFVVSIDQYIDEFSRDKDISTREFMKKVADLDQTPQMSRYL